MRLRDAHPPPALKPWERLRISCTWLQVIGILLILRVESLPAYGPVLIGITGFAGVAKYYLIDARTPQPLRTLHLGGAMLGGLIIVLACVLAVR